MTDMPEAPEGPEITIDLESITLTELHRSTGDIVTAAAYGRPALISKRGAPFVIILPADNPEQLLAMARQYAQTMREKESNHDETPPT